MAQGIKLPVFALVIRREAAADSMFYLIEVGD